MIYPNPDELGAPFWEAARRHELVIQHCEECNTCWHPPLPRCPNCQSGRLAWRPVSGRAVVYSYTDVHHSVHAVTESWMPYRLYLIDLEEGPRLVSNQRNVRNKPGMEIGTPVRVAFEDIGNNVVLPQFVPAEDAAR